MGIGRRSLYTEPSEVFKEIEEATKIYRKKRITIIDVTNKPIESSADDIIAKIISRFSEDEDNA